MARDNKYGFYRDIEITQNGGIATSKQNGVPLDFTKQSETSSKIRINKGQSNALKIRPRILNEYVESSSTIQASVGVGTSVGQIFKASQDNINSIMLTLGSLGGTTNLDNFESYANSAALQTTWVEGIATTPALLELSKVPVGSVQSMALTPLIFGDKWTNTIAPTSFLNGNINFDFYNGDLTNLFAIEISDGVNFSQVPINPTVRKIWQNFSIPAISFVGVNLAAITSISIVVNKFTKNKLAYLDNLSFSLPTGFANITLHDMGATIPVSGVTSLSNGVQYTTIGDSDIQGITYATYSLALKGGKRKYFLSDFVAGAAIEDPLNNTLTVGNYYAITIDYVDTIVDVYGQSPTSANKYNNGFSYTSTLTTTPITKIGVNNNCMFMIFSTDDVYLLETKLVFNTTPGVDASFSILTESVNDSVEVLSLGESELKEIQEEIFDFKPIYLQKGGKLELYYEDDAVDSVTTATIEIAYLFKNKVNNG